MVRSVVASIGLLCAALVAHSASGRDIELLDFTSPHCVYCQQMAPTIHSLINARYPIRQVDVTVEPQTAATYHVERLPTLIMLVDGQVFRRTEGAASGQQITAMFQDAGAELERRNQIRLQSPDRLAANQASVGQHEVVPAGDTWPAAQRQTPATFGPADAPQLTQPRTDLPRSAFGDTRPGTVATSSPVDARVARLIGASVRLRVDEENGRSFGTGTIIDARQGQALVVTCGHLFRDTKGQGPVTVEMFEATPGGVRSAGQVPGQVISFDLDRDVALVAIRPDRNVTVAKVAPPRTEIQRGDRVVSVGCSNGQDPTALASRITSLDRYQGAPNIEASGAPVEGRSGGGLFNEAGELIGVCFAADREGNEGLYAALKAIHDELSMRGLSEVFTPRSLLAADGDAGATRRQPGSGPIVRGQDPGSTGTPGADRGTLAPGTDRDTPSRSMSGVTPLAVNISAPSAPAAPPAGLNATEQAAWDEIMRRAATSEVICIIRPKQPGGQSEVITLDNVSADFVRALASRSQPTGPQAR